MYEDFLSRYRIVDRRGRLSSNLSRSRHYPELVAELLSVTSGLPDGLSIRERLIAVARDIKSWPRCEITTCGAPVKLVPTGFSAFCSFKCSRTLGSSTWQRVSETCQRRYGSKSYLSSTKNRQQIVSGGGFGYARPETREKIKLTNLQKFGVENPFAHPAVKRQIELTHLSRYGGNFHTMKLGKKLQLLEDKAYCSALASEHCLSTICSLLGIASNTVYRYFELHGITSFNSSRSRQEGELANFLATLGVQGVVQGDRTLIKPYEIDVLLPERQLGFEMNGIWWHSELAGCQPGYHLKKLNLAAAAGTRLIHVFESEWVLKNNIVKSRISSLLGKNETIAGRSTRVEEVDAKTKSDFFKKHHLQGDVFSSINLGLIHAGELVACASFGKSRFCGSDSIELLRFASRCGTNVVGGFSKLLAAFRRGNPWRRCISYADKRWSVGDLYAKNGFIRDRDSAPSYFYFKGSSLILESRLRYQKHKLARLLNTFDPALSEWANMQAAGYNRIWDCGTTKWILPAGAP